MTGPFPLDQQADAAQLWPVADLETWDRNPRFIRDERFEALKRAMVADPAMLWVRPLVAREHNRVVIMGNMRLRAARDLGWEVIPTMLVTIDDDTAALWALRDNQQYGDWNEADLAEFLRELELGGNDLDLTGFDPAELERILATATWETAPIEDDLVPSIPAEPITKPGEVIHLGRHRLVCGDARDPEALRSATGSVLAACVWTDPPYGVSYVGGTLLRIANDDLAGLGDLLSVAFRSMTDAVAGGTPIYVAYPDGGNSRIFLNAAHQAGWRLHETLIWVKNSLVLGRSDYHYRHEPILLAYSPGGVGLRGRGGRCWYGDDSQTTIFEVDRPSRSEEHPTMKPVELIAQMLRNSSTVGDVVLDPFAGSGSTLIACERLGRTAALVEIDPAYCDVIRARWDALPSA